MNVVEWEDEGLPRSGWLSRDLKFGAQESGESVPGEGEPAVADLMAVVEVPAP